MADILIRGMEMPENCGECVFLRKLEKATPYTSRFWCCIKGNAVLKHEKSKYCPLVPLPEGHGRLIDADALLNNNGVGTQIAGWGKMVHETAIAYAPTIVPAEGGENE